LPKTPLPRPGKLELQVYRKERKVPILSCMPRDQMGGRSKEVGKIRETVTLKKNEFREPPAVPLALSWHR